MPKTSSPTWTTRSRTYGELEHSKLKTGHEVRRRASDQYGDGTALFRAARKIAAANPDDIELRARNLRMDYYLAAEATQRRLKAVSRRTGLPIRLSDLTAEQQGLTGQRALIEVRAGGITWLHPDIYLHACAALHAGIEDEIYQWYGKARRQARRILLPVEQQLVDKRKQQNASLSTAAHDRGIPPMWVHKARVRGLTGEDPAHWTAEYGEGWLQNAPAAHQFLHGLAAGFGALAMLQVDERQTRGELPDDSRSHWLKGVKEAAQDVRMLGEKYGIPLVPDPAGAHRGLAAAAQLSAIDVEVVA